MMFPRVTIQHWQGATPADVAGFAHAAGCDGVLWKALDGMDWMSTYDPQGIGGYADVMALRDFFHGEGMKFGVWTNPLGRVSVEGQVANTALAAREADFLAIDVEPYPQFWRHDNPPDKARMFMEMLRGELGDDYPILIQPDPRPARLAEIRMEEWAPYADGWAGQWYWNDFQRPVTEVIGEALSSFHRWGIRPLVTLPGNAPHGELVWAASELAANGCEGLVLWRYGTTPLVTAQAIAAVFKASAPPPAEGDTMTPEQKAEIVLRFDELDDLLRRLRDVSRLRKRDREAMAGEALARSDLLRRALLA